MWGEPTFGKGKLIFEVGKNKYGFHCLTKNIKYLAGMDQVISAFFSTPSLKYKHPR